MTIQCVTCRYLHTAVNEAPCNCCKNFDKWETEDYRTVEELEKLKSEIIEYRSEHNCGVVECLDFIDKHISELKGENNGKTTE